MHPYLNYVDSNGWHVVRLDGTRPVKKLLENKPGERKKKGRPRGGPMLLGV